MVQNSAIMSVVKVFNPLGAATWLISELVADGDALFGLADLGFGCPELASVSLAELSSVRLPLGLGDRARPALRRAPSALGPCRSSARAGLHHREPGAF